MPNSKRIECVFQIPVVVTRESDSSCIFLVVLMYHKCFLPLWMDINHEVQMPWYMKYDRIFM